MTAPGGPAGPRPQGPAGPGPARPDDPPKLSAAAIVAAIDDNVRLIAASLPDLTPSAMDKVADIWRRNWRRPRVDKAA